MSPTLSTMAYSEQLQYLDSLLKDLDPSYTPPDLPPLPPLLAPTLAPPEHMASVIGNYERRRRSVCCRDCKGRSGGTMGDENEGGCGRDVRDERNKGGDRGGESRRGSYRKESRRSSSGENLGLLEMTVHDSEEKLRTLRSVNCDMIRHVSRVTSNESVRTDDSGRGTSCSDSSDQLKSGLKRYIRDKFRSCGLFGRKTSPTTEPSLNDTSDSITSPLDSRLTQVELQYREQRAGTTCSACSLPLSEVPSLHLHTTPLTYHSRCFCCVWCGEKLTGSSGKLKCNVFVVSGMPTCDCCVRGRRVSKGEV